jgi:hypothetical protein
MPAWSPWDHSRRRAPGAVYTWVFEREAGSGRGVDWRFTTEDARIKLKHLYPVIQG